MNTKRKVFSGCATALVTPFKNGEVDFEALCRLIDFQLENGARALVLLGTTGESPTVDKGEREEIIRVAREKIGTRAPLIVGTGSNSTKNAVNLTQGAEKSGADAVLCVTPYYNKATEKGLCEHYLSIAESTALPIILYNVPSRTGMELSRGALYALAGVENIVAIKEASSDVSKLGEKISEFKDAFYFYSGCDELILPAYSLGACGVISAVSNVIPREISTLCSLFEGKRTDEASALALKLAPVIRELFAEVNPVPVKRALSLMGMCENELRLPLTPSSRTAQIEKALQYINEMK